MTITHNTLDLTVQGHPSGPSEHQTWDPPSPQVLEYFLVFSVIVIICNNLIKKIQISQWGLSSIKLRIFEVGRTRTDIYSFIVKTIVLIYKL